MSANDVQHGGSHYNGGYQHWDWVADIRLPYHPACASKYVARNRFKGVQLLDLEKSGHYLDKTMELGRSPALNSREVIGTEVLTRRFADSQKLTPQEEQILLAIALGHYVMARVYISDLLRSVMQEQPVAEAAQPR